jgi:hypothetical protein
MNIIAAINNIDKNSWTIKTLDPMPSVLKIGFFSSDPNKAFDNLKFGFTINLGKSIVHEKSYPVEFYSYEKSSQEFLEMIDVPMQPDKTYTLNLWAENAGVRSDFSYSFKTPIPSQPHLSWNWSGNDWVPPVAQPTDGRPYDWNENLQQWILDTED